MTTGRCSRERKGNPAAGLAILATIFGVAVVFGLLPSPSLDLVSRPEIEVLPSRVVSVWSEAPAPLDRVTLAPAMPAPLARPGRRILEASPAVDPLTLAAAAMDPPPAFVTDAGEPPVLASTPLVFAAPLAAVEPAAVAGEIDEGRPQPARAFSAAFDRTGSAIRVAFRRTGEGVRSAFGAIR